MAKLTSKDNQVISSAPKVDLRKILNKSLKDEIFMDTTSLISDKNVKEFISTGSPALDMIISNKAVGGGIPVSRLVEISGQESCVTDDTLIDILIE